MSNSIFVESSEMILKFQGIVFEDFIHESNFETKKDILFYRCTFKNPIVLEKITSREITFFECIFEKEFYLQESNFHSISFFGCDSKQDINIISSTSDVLSFRGIKVNKIEINGIYHDLQIISTKAESLLINDVNNSHTYRESKIVFLVENEIKRIDFKCSHIFSEILFTGSDYEEIFFEGEFKKRIDFKGDITVQNLHFESSIFHSRIDIENGSYEYIYFYRSSFNGLVYINDLEILEKGLRDINIKSLSLHSSNFQKDVVINLSKIEMFNSSHCNYNEVLNLNNYFKNTCESDDFVMVSIDGVNQGNIVIENIYADITLGGINFGNIYFRDIDISTIYLSDYQNIGVLSFSNIRTGNYLVIQNSTTGKMNFINSDINLFNEIIIADSNIDDANFYKYPKRVLAQSKNPKMGYGISKKSSRILNLKNVYNQLKRNAKSKGDIDIARKFESLEYKQLLLSKRIGFDSFILFLNFISNNNGNSWFRGVVFTLLTGLLFFILYLKTLNIDFYFDESYKDYIIFMSSFPKLELKKHIISIDNWQTQLVLWLSRIFISYGIYQTIAAFRKYGKG